MFYSVYIQFILNKIVRTIPKKNKEKIFRNMIGSVKFYVAAENSEQAKLDGIVRLKNQIINKDFFTYFHYDDKNKLIPLTTSDFYISANTEDLNIDKCNVKKLTTKETLENFSIDEVSKFFKNS